MRGNTAPVLPQGLPGRIGPARSEASSRQPLRIYQLFVNVEGLDVRVRRPLLGMIPFGRRKAFGFYAVMTLAAPAASKPPLLLSLAGEALAAEFAPLSATTPEQWSVQQVEWREVSAAPPMFHQPGCVDQEWGAVWYELGDEAAKQHRYRLARSRLWKGRRVRCDDVPPRHDDQKAG